MHGSPTFSDGINRKAFVVMPPWKSVSLHHCKHFCFPISKDNSKSVAFFRILTFLEQSDLVGQISNFHSIKPTINVSGC